MVNVYMYPVKQISVYIVGFSFFTQDCGNIVQPDRCTKMVPALRCWL